MTRFIEGTAFEGVKYPRFDTQPNGPQSQSFTRCVCGLMWNAHRMRDGACPEQPNTKPSNTNKET